METIKMTAKAYSEIEINEGDENDALFSSRSGIKMLIVRTFKAGVEFAQRWIPIEEELPDANQVVLIKWNYEGREHKTTGTLVARQLVNYWASGSATQLNVTHWRPIERS